MRWTGRVACLGEGITTNDVQVRKTSRAENATLEHGFKVVWIGLVRLRAGTSGGLLSTGE
jgi:hypothetical protein